MKRLLPALLAVILLCSCVAQPAAPEQKQYTATFLDVFDTVTTIVGRADSQETFEAAAQAIHDDLLFYHQRLMIPYKQIHLGKFYFYLLKKVYLQLCSYFHLLV